VERDERQGEAAQADGAYLARTPGDAALGAGIVITMLADEDVSTIGLAATKRCAALANRKGVGFVDAPVLGTRQPAE
jgi:3-hydroxyisobutyrate dehydrogenase